MSRNQANKMRRGGHTFIFTKSSKYKVPTIHSRKLMQAPTDGEIIAAMALPFIIAAKKWRKNA